MSESKQDLNSSFARIENVSSRYAFSIENWGSTEDDKTIWNVKMYNNTEDSDELVWSGSGLDLGTVIAQAMVAAYE